MATSAEIQAAAVAYGGFVYGTAEIVITIPTADWASTPVGPFYVMDKSGVEFQYDETGAGDWPGRRTVLADGGRWKIIDYDAPVVNGANVEWTVRIWEMVRDTLANNLAVHMDAGVLRDATGVLSPAQVAGTLTNSSTDDISDRAYIYTDDNYATAGAKIGTTGRTLTLAWDATYNTTFGQFDTGNSSSNFSEYPVSILVDPGGRYERVVRSTTVDTDATGALDVLYAIVNLDGVIYRGEDFEVTVDGRCVDGRNVGNVYGPTDSYRKVGRSFIWNLGPSRPARRTSVSLRGLTEVNVPIEATTLGDATGTVVVTGAFFVGYTVVDGDRTLGTGYTLSITIGASGPTIVTNAVSAADNAVGNLAIPVPNNSTLVWTISGAAASSEGTLRLFFNGR